ncbi:MAG TPA: PKD domain-containing protein, partial [Brumimicrobium sp.]|nr:PKD domain-containing protein [Brumimicrobium sp.]
MKNEIYNKWRKALLGFCLITSFLVGNSFNVLAQAPPGISISWDKEVGCQTYELNRDKEGSVFIENIEPSDCIRVCENSDVIYTLANIPPTATIVWNVVGGTTTNNSSSSCLVNWGTAGTGALSFTVTDGNSITSKTICIEKVVSPTALFDVVPLGQIPISVCAEQQVYFTNLSSTNNGTNLVSHLWDFGDGNTSTAFEPSHTYTNSGNYAVTLTVKNECNCTDTYKMELIVDKKGFEISCPTVICEGQSGIYSVPEYVSDHCGSDSNWSVIGGQILSQSNKQVEVLWDDVDESGFGYVTFNPSGCDLECTFPTTVKVPVIQTNGKIQGIESICIGGQGRYKLPQWPTTEIEWEIIGNVGNNIGQILQTDQRNEIIVEPYMTGTFVLRATYTNTLLKCSGEAEFVFKVEEPLTVSGASVLCKNSTEIYTNSSGNPVNWTLTTNIGTVVTTQNNAVNFNYTFNQAGNYILTANQTGYCSGEQKTITVLEVPDMPTGVIGDLYVCPSAPYSYSVQNPDPSSNYFWSIDPMYGSLIGSNEGDEVNITFTGTFPAEISVYKKTIHPVECESDPLIVTIHQIPIDVEISSDMNEVCANSLAVYNAYESNSTNLYTDGDDYIWSFENASPSTISAASLGSVSNGQGTNSIEVTWNNVSVTTTVDLVLEVAKCNTTTQVTKQITLYPQTEIELLATPNPVCAGSLYPVTFTVQSANTMPLAGTEIVTWDLGNGTFTTPPGQFTYTTNLVNNSVGNIALPVSAYIANGSCGQSNTAHTTVTVLPNPPAIATLTSSANLFCDSADVYATITVSSSTSGVTFQWFKDNVLIPGETSTSINITPTMMGAGSYTFQATNTNGCIAVSNPVGLFVKSCDSVNCTMPYVVQNNAELTACGEITFSGTATGPIISEEWLVLGPSLNDYVINGNVLTGKPGNYKIIYDVKYPCLESGEGIIRKVKDIVIPYEPAFSYTVECNSNNTFNVNFIDESNFYAPVSPQNVRFYYKLASASTFIGPISYDPSLTVFEISNLPAGNYTFKQEVDGNYPNTPFFICEKEYTVNLEGVESSTAIILDNDPVPCHNTAVGFSLFPSSPDITVLWDFGEGAQNTMSSPKRVFSVSDTTYNVSVVVTNALGCSAEFTKPVTIPKECFFGDIVSTPSPATVCKNETVDLTYIPNGDNCDVVTYVWMNGNVPVSGAPNNATLTVGTSGFYWVKVKSADGCEYSSPTQIKPLFETLPTVKLLGESTVCVGSDIKYKVSTNASIIRWYVAGNHYVQFDDLTEADFTGLLALGNHSVTVEVTAANGCTNTATMNMSVEEALTNITFDIVSYSCSPAQVTIQAIPNPANPNIIYNWSNGASTQTITVQDGGPYRVTASLGGCSISREIDIPRHPESYMWIYPTGCYTDCRAEKDGFNSYLIGPTLPLPSWSWNESGTPVQSGSGTYQSPFSLSGSGVYSSTINTGPCEMESASLDYTLKDCEECKIREVEIKEIVPNETPYCSFTFNIVIYSGLPFPFQATLSDDFNNVLILPSSFTINPGMNTYQFTVIPQSPFNGGITNWTIQGSVLTDEGYRDCVYRLQVRVPKCKEGFSPIEIRAKDRIRAELEEELLQVYPNPAKDVATVKYELTSSNASLEVYDLLGKSLFKQNLSVAKGEVRLNT